MSSDQASKPSRRAQPKRVGRRQFVTSASKWGAAASALFGLPLLSEMRATAQEQFPLRVVLIFNPNGTIQEEFWPTLGASDREFTFNAITKPLEPFKDRLLFLKGLTIGVAEVGPGGPHQKGVGGLFTNSELQTGTFVDGDGSKAGWANGISIDQELAKRVGQSSFLTSLELGVRAITAEVRSRISYAGPANPMPPINSPSAAFERVFSGVGEISETLRVNRHRVVDALKEQYAELTPRLARVDQLKVEQHLDMVRGIERRLDISVDTSACQLPDQPPELSEDDETTMAQISTLQSELMALAFGCDLTRIGSLQYSSAINDIRYPWVDSLGSGHTLSHAGPTNTEAKEELIRRYTWHAEEMAHLMSVLDSIPEGEGTALDNTIIVWGNELGMGNAHSHTDIPFVVGGGAGGKWDMGRFIEFGGVPHSGLMVSLLHAMGFDDTVFGHPEFSDGPLVGLTV